MELLTLEIFHEKQTKSSLIINFNIRLNTQNYFETKKMCLCKFMFSLFQKSEERVTKHFKENST